MKRGFMAFFCGSLLFLGCSQDPELLVDNGTASETTNHISGVITEDNTPASGADVYLFSVNYNPVNKKDDSQFSRSVQTGESGEYLFEKIPEGDYHLIARSKEDGSAALIRSIQVTEDKPDIGSLDIELVRTGTISISLKERSAKEGDYFYIPGTDLQTQVDAPSLSRQSADIGSVPPGTYADINHAQTASSSGEDIIAREFTLEPEEIAVVGPYSQWKYKSRVSINTSGTGANVSEDVLGFPLLVRLTSDHVTLTPQGGAKSDGSDLRFTKSDHITTLPYEIERWDQENGIAEVWVKIDTVFRNNDGQFIYMYTGKSDAPAQSSGRDVFNTEEGFVGAYHMHDDSRLVDASGNENHGTIYGVIDTEDWSDAVVGHGLELDGDSQFVWTEKVYEYPNVFTLSLWFRTTEPGGKLIGFEEGPDFHYDHDRQIWMGDDGKVYFGVYPWPPDSIAPEDSMYLRGDTGMEMTVYTESALNDGRWHRVSATLSEQGQYLFIDGQEVASKPRVISGENFIGNWRIGYGNLDNWIHRPVNYDFTGTIDEVRISHAGRSPAWVKLSFENQKEGSSVVRIED